MLILWLVWTIEAVLASVIISLNAPSKTGVYLQSSALAGRTLSSFSCRKMIKDAGLILCWLSRHAYSYFLNITLIISIWTKLIFPFSAIKEGVLFADILVCSCSAPCMRSTHWYCHNSHLLVCVSWIKVLKLKSNWNLGFSSIIDEVWAFSFTQQAQM